MTARRTRPGHLILIVPLLAALLISACSSTRLAYRYADWGIIWWAEDYVSLNSAQKSRLEADIDRFRQWHCSTQLPRYADWLEELLQDVATRKLEPPRLRQHQQQILQLLDPLVERILPPATALLADLTPAQVEELQANMAQRQAEMEDEYLKQDPEQTAASRAERIQERTERWLGALTSEQITLIEQWSRTRKGQTRIWLEGRANWQQAFLEVLDDRNQDDFQRRLADLIENHEAYRGADYQAMIEQILPALRTLISDLLAAAEPRQWRHLEKEISGLRWDFESLTCNA